MFKNHTENLTFISGFLIWIRERLEIRLDLFYDFVHPSYVHMHTYSWGKKGLNKTQYME